ncbi:glycosyltransferase family 2 protein [Paenibacillus sedimenti]|uniref:Glycosyltransferase n=1 Tax=Paenibacillus sedimenti TaxID=2770274 RepID=A0A926QKB8_9BACL|nr:glycosyltransferase [Paenibacillus sedimenti]MBD0381568.1 glycosyltransferase [Paenibacillus sedimenti]
MSNQLDKKVTAIIKTFERPHCVDLLIRSIRKYYPTLPIIVADDSEQPTIRNDVEFHALPMDSGVSMGRNYLVKQVKTPYVLLLDDDFYFIRETKIEELLRVLENTNIDIVAGRCLEERGVRSSQGTFSLEKGVLYINTKSYEKEFKVKLYDIVTNFFLARTKSLLQCTWDERFKTGGEHLDFFLNHKGKLKVAMHPKIFIYHFNDMSIEKYNHYRNRDKEKYDPIFRKKHSITKIKREHKFFQPLSSVKNHLSTKTIKYLLKKGLLKKE